MAARVLGVQDVIRYVLEDEQSAAVEKSSENNQPRILHLLFGCKIDAGLVFRRESVVWLDGIYRRLAGKRSIQRPYYLEIKRDIPEEIFRVLSKVIECNTDQLYNPPNCFVSENKKAIVVSFTSIITFKEFLSSLSSKDVNCYMERTLGGYRKGYCVKPLVTDVKDFALTYYIRKGQLVISFNFGELERLWISTTWLKHVFKINYLDNFILRFRTLLILRKTHFWLNMELLF